MVHSYRISRACHSPVDMVFRFNPCQPSRDIRHICYLARISIIAILSRCGPSWLRENYPRILDHVFKGKAYERGVMNGKLSKTLICKQEKAFVKQIRMMIPSDFYLHFLKYFIYWFNRDLDKSISEEQKRDLGNTSQQAKNLVL